MPTRDTAWPAGTPCWIDYGAADLEATKAFYTDLLGWTYTGGEEEYGGYLTAQVNEHPAARVVPHTLKLAVFQGFHFFGRGRQPKDSHPRPKCSVGTR